LKPSIVPSFFVCNLDFPNGHIYRSAFLTLGWRLIIPNDWGNPTQTVAGDFQSIWLLAFPLLSSDREDETVVQLA
jgi:hypothetical protein